MFMPGTLKFAFLSSKKLRSLFLGLRRHTTTGLYIPELDGLRFVAIFSVYIYHVAGDVLRHTPTGISPSTSFLFRLTQQLNVGVPLFFAISGMILGLPFGRYWLQGGPKVPLKRYLLRRLTRLEPPYILALLLFFALKLLSHRGEAAQMLPHFGASIAYLHNLIYREPSTINFVAWSLEVEVQFYLLAPVLALVFAVGRNWIRRSILAAAIVISSLMAGRLGPVAHLTLAGNIQYFLAGFLLAEIFLTAPPVTNRRHLWDLASVVGWPSLAILLVYDPPAVDVALPILILLLYLGAFYGTTSSAAFANIWPAAIGGMCYTIYLLHNYIVAVVGMVTERIAQGQSFELRLLAQISLISPFILLVSIIYYKCVEQPCMRPDWPVRLKRFFLDRILGGGIPVSSNVEG
jgi:peptidoglycan/LPS O-acetylase OafA/YrhL